MGLSSSADYSLMGQRVGFGEAFPLSVPGTDRVLHKSYLSLMVGLLAMDVF